MNFLDKLPQYPGCIYVIDELWLPEAVSISLNPFFTIKRGCKTIIIIFLRQAEKSAVS